MAGGVYNWSQGAVLDAADLNEFVANQVIARFANEAARTAAYGVVNAPAVQAGLFAWTADNGKLYYHNGTSWIEVGAQVEDGEIVTAKIADSAVTSAKIADGAIVNADVNASAAIADSKIAGTAITAADTGTVTSTMIANDTILDADIKSNAAIAYSKLSLSNSIATTDLAAGAARAGFNSTQNQVVTASSNYTLVLGDLAKLVEVNEASACTLTIPTNATVAFAVGDRIDVLQTGAGQVTITPVSGTVTINGFDGGLKLNGQWAAATLIKRATNTWVAVGNLTT